MSTVERVVETKPYDSTTLNTWLAVLSTVSAAMTREHELPRDPALGLKRFTEDVSYQPDAPNALSPERNEIGDFLAEMKVRYPQHYAMAFLGFAIGHRPSDPPPAPPQGGPAGPRFQRGRIGQALPAAQPLREAGGHGTHEDGRSGRARPPERDWACPQGAHR